MKEEEQLGPRQMVHRLHAVACTSGLLLSHAVIRNTTYTTQLSLSGIRAARVGVVEGESIDTEYCSSFARVESSSSSQFALIDRHTPTSPRAQK